MIFIRHRYIIFTVLILFAALCVSFFIIRDNWYYISIFLANLLFAVFYEKGPVQTRFFISSIILAISFLVIYTMDNFILYFFKGNQDFKLASFLFGVVVSVTLLLVPFGLFFNDFEQKVIDHAKKNRIAKKFPHLVCAKHHTRTFMESHFIYSAAICRNDADCSSENIIVAKELIGFIGKIEQKKVNNGKHYVELFSKDSQTVINGDYDIIEVYKSSDIQDYDAVIYKVTSFLYNELDRYKPVNEITFRISDDIPISESTKRLLEKQFGKVEYLMQELSIN